MPIDRLSCWKNHLSPLLLGIGFALSACTSLQVVELADGSLQQTLAPGDTVVVTRHNGQRHTFELIAITHSGLEGEAITVPFEDIALLQVRRFDKQKTILLTVALIAAAAAAGGGGGGGGY